MDNQRLLIRISRDRFAFATVAGQQVCFEQYPLNTGISQAANMREALRNLPVLQADYASVSVLTNTPLLVMPIDLFREEEQEPLYAATFTRQEQQLVMHAVLPDLHAVALFSIHKDFRQVLADRFGTVRYQPLMASVWHHTYQKSFTGQHAKLYGYLHDRQIEVFAFGQNRFKFQNTFSVQTADDALYYLLSAWKQLGMEARMDELHLAGQDAVKQQLLDMTQQFIKRVFVNNPSGEFNRAPVTQIEDMPYDMMLYFLKGN